MNQDISVVIPAYFNSDEFKLTFTSVLSQSKCAKEIIVIDSSKDDLIKDYVDDISNAHETEIIYVRPKERLFPGAARNLGVSFAKHDWIAFLDSKTIPTSDWLKSTLDAAISCQADLVFGKTKYQARTSFQFLVLASTYGYDPITTLPGTLISREKFLLTDGFNSMVRSGEDVQWRAEASNKFAHINLEDGVALSYASLPKNLYKASKKFFTYQMHTALVDIQINAKSVFLALFLIIVTLIVPRWNSLLPGWDTHPLYIPDITKIYILSITFTAMFLLFFNRSIFALTGNSPISRAFKLVILILALTIAWRWNHVVAGFVESSSLYIPHITKIFISSIGIAAIYFRGIYFPFKHGLVSKDIFPFQWIGIGMVGIFLDIIKAPGYIIGAIWKILKI
jgi:glycosyltransferase involved in cell wall biosynthesis